MAINPNDLASRIAAYGFPGQGQVRIPSEAEKAEVAKVQGMQVRTQAANMATHLLAARQTSQQVWSKWAIHIETYIKDGYGADFAPLRPGS
jgi:hypothetical protein